ncbi:MAG: hypothetical protein R3E87_02960 [Burkholderiaceae bacterium]
MAIESSYVLMASMDVEPDKEALFNEVYDEHCAFLLQVPGVRSVSRLKGEPFQFSIAGEIKSLPAPKPVYTAVYELDSPAVPASAEWAAAVEKGRWAAEVRPYTSNRAHAMYRKLG